MTDLEEIKRLLETCTHADREELFGLLREEFPLHPLEAELHAKAEIILEAIQRGGDLTKRMIRGVIAEAAFGVEIVERLEGWAEVPVVGDLAYDFHLRDCEGDVRIQVKLQRSKEGRVMWANEARRRDFLEGFHVVETQKTRGGTSGKSGEKTRPYRFGEFDILAVSMYPSRTRWDAFMYTPARWLLPDKVEPTHIFKYQPVPVEPNDDWTDDFATSVAWFRSGAEKHIAGRKSRESS